MNYDDFLARKRLMPPALGLEIDESDINRRLFPFQRHATRWALKRGRAALFEECGLGKSWQALEWSRIVAERTRRPVLILTPLAVAQQFVAEGSKIDVPVIHLRNGGETRFHYGDDAPGSGATIGVCNYERLDHLRQMIPHLGGVVLDESSILKAFDGKTRTALIEAFAATPYRLCCTATPSPNDVTELGNHAEFLGVMRHVDMLSRFFEHAGDDTSKWTLKGHARKHFWQWVGSWALCARKPSDLGDFSDEGYDLPALQIHEHVVDVDADAAKRAGLLFGFEAVTLAEQRDVRRSSIEQRIAVAAARVNADDEQWSVWCELNAESEKLAKACRGAVEVTGSDPAEKKEMLLTEWLAGKHRVLVTKPSICGFGINAQQCARQMWPGIGHSYESWHQTVRRSWRFGQRCEVEVHMVRTSADGRIADNLRRKQQEAENMSRQMIEVMRGSALSVAGGAAMGSGVGIV